MSWMRDAYNRWSTGQEATESSKKLLLNADELANLTIQPAVKWTHQLSTNVAGTGTSLANAWTNWDSIITSWPTDGIEFRFAPGHYSYSNTLAPHVNNISMIGSSGVFLHYTGTNRAVSFDGRSYGGNGYAFHNIQMDGFNIDGGSGSNMLVGLYYDQIFNARFDNISVSGFTQANTNTIGFDLQFGIVVSHRRLTSRGDILIPTNNASTPAVGMRLGDTTVPDPNNPPCQCACSYYDCDIEFSRIFGLWAKNGFNCSFHSGDYATTKNGQDLQSESLFRDSSFIAVDFEGLSGTSRIVLNGPRLKFDNCDGNSNLIVNSAGNRFEGGRGYGTYSDTGGGNEYAYIQGMTLSSVTGSGSNTATIVTTSGAWKLPALTITGGASGGLNILDMHDQTTGGQGTFLRVRSDRTSHVKDWWVGTGIVGGSSFVIYDNLNSVTPFQVNEDDSIAMSLTNGVSVNKLTITNTLINSGNYGAQVSVTDPTACDFDLFANNTAGGAGYVQWRSNKTAANKTWQLGIGIVSGNSLVVYDVQTGIVPFKISETDGVIIGGAGTNTIGFYGSTGSTKQTVAAAATDAATTQTLANSIRTILLNLGIC